MVSGVHVVLPADLATISARLVMTLPDLEELKRLVQRTSKELADRRRLKAEPSEGEVEEVARALKGLDRGEARRVLY